MNKKSLLLLLVMLPLFGGCSLLRLPGLPTPKGPQTVYNWSETVTRKPRAVVADGKIIVVEDVTHELVVGYEKVTPKQTFIQKIGAWISGLGIVGFVLLAVGFVFMPGATIAFLIGMVRKWKNAMKETVIAIKESKATEDAAVKAALSDKQSTATKAIVDSIKRTI